MDCRVKSFECSVKDTKIPEKNKNVLKMEYEPEVDVLTIYFKSPETTLSHSDETEGGVILNYDADGRLVSVEMLDARQRYPASQLAAVSVDEFIDLKTASAISGIAPVTLRTQAEKDKLWTIRLAGQWLTTCDRLQQYIDSHARPKRVTDIN